MPVGVATTLEWVDTEIGILTLTGSVTSIDGQEHVEHTIEERVSSLEEAEQLGAKLAKILIETGARKILDDINVDRARRIQELNST